jgi:hypothetical protein
MNNKVVSIASRPGYTSHFEPAVRGTIKTFSDRQVAATNGRKQVVFDRSRNRWRDYDECPTAAQYGKRPDENAPYSYYRASEEGGAERGEEIATSKSCFAGSPELDYLLSHQEEIGIDFKLGYTYWFFGTVFADQDDDRYVRGMIHDEDGWVEVVNYLHDRFYMSGYDRIIVLNKRRKTA